MYYHLLSRSSITSVTYMLVVIIIAHCSLWIFQFMFMNSLQSLLNFIHSYHIHIESSYIHLLLIAHNCSLFYHWYSKASSSTMHAKISSPAKVTAVNNEYVCLSLSYNRVNKYSSDDQLINYICLTIESCRNTLFQLCCPCQTYSGITCCG